MVVDFRILDFRLVVNRDKPRNFVTMILINDLGGREWSSNAMFVVKAEGQTSQASVFRCFPRQSSTTFSMTLLGAMNSHIQAKRVSPAWESNLGPSAFCAGALLSNH